VNTELRSVFMMKRVASANFMPNAYVFPGGKVDAQIDGKFPLEKTNWQLEGEEDQASSPGSLGSIFGNDKPKPMVERRGAMGLDGYGDRIAAVRELFEESGLLMVEEGNNQR